MSKEKRDKLVLVCLLITGVLGALYTFVLGAQKDKLNGYSNSILTVKDRLGKAESLLRRGPNVEERLQENRKKLEQMQKDMAPMGQQYYSLGKIIQEFVASEGIDPDFFADQLQPQFGEAGLLPNFPYRAAFLGVKTSGHFHDTGRFIANFENKYPYMRIENIYIRPQGKERSGIRPRTSQGLGKPEQEPLEGTPNEDLVSEFRIVTLVRPNTT